MAAARKSAPKGKAKAKAKARPRRVKTTRATPLKAVLTTPAAQLATTQEREFSRDDFRMSIDDMEMPRLRAYARSIGILQRDVEHLTEDRLRQNCKARVMQSFEDA